MPRPRKCRQVGRLPSVDYFKPRGVPMQNLTEKYLPVEGYEALRLAEIQGLSFEQAAQKMNISRHTFGRILAQARKTLAEAVVNGHALHIQGGHYEMRDQGGQGNEEETKNPAVPAAEPLNTAFQSALPEAESSGSNSPANAGTSIKETNVSKVAVSSEGPSLDDKVDPRFGRAAGFVIVDLDTMETTYIDNGSTQAMAQGAGIQSAELIAKSGAKVVLSGFVGPKAFQGLNAAGIKVGQDLVGKTIREAVEAYKAGEVTFAQGPNR